MQHTSQDLRHILAQSKPLAIDLFSGVGGLSLGLECAGFFVATHVEIEAITARYAHYNFPLADMFHGEAAGDIRQLSGPDLRRSLPPNQDIALVAGGPPCQGFSYAGKKNPADPLNDLVLDFARVVLEIQPQAFLMENVPGIRAGAIWQLDQALETLNANYHISSPTLLEAPDYGVPQMRKRVFILGFRHDLGLTPQLPSPTHTVQPSLLGLPLTPTVQEALSDLPDVDAYPHLINGDRVDYAAPPQTDYQYQMRDQEWYAERRGYAVTWDATVCTNCRRTRHGESLRERLAALAEGQADRKSGIRRLEANGISTTIRAGTTSRRGSWSAPRPCHYHYDRVITTRECARLQSFPDWFRFHPIKWHGNRQVGNAVPPRLAEAIGVTIMRQLGYETAHGILGTVQRPDDLIAADIAAAENAGLDQRNITYQVIKNKAGT